MSNTPYSGDQQTTKDVAADQAGQVKDQARTAGKDVAEHAKAEAQGVAQDAKDQARGLFDTSMGEVRGQVRNQQGRLASGVRSAAQELGAMADHADVSSPAGPLARRVSSTGNDLANWLENHEPDDVLDQVRRYASRNPWTFLAMAAGAGLLVGRFARSMQAERSDDNDDNHYRGQAQARAGYYRDEARRADYVDSPGAYPGHSVGQASVGQGYAPGRTPAPGTQPYPSGQPGYQAGQPGYHPGRPGHDQQAGEHNPAGYDPSLGYQGPDTQGGAR